MTHLAKALEEHYQRSGSKILFASRFSLSDLALQMWEELNYGQIDSSVLSRVLKGQRLFTSIQLAKFCEILGIYGTKKEALFNCLYQDFLERGGFSSISFFISNNSLLDLLDNLSTQTEEMFLSGQCNDLKRLCMVLEPFVDELLETNKNQEVLNKFCDYIGKIIFMNGWAIGCLLAPDEVLVHLKGLSNKLDSIAKRYNSKKCAVFSHYLLCLAYYAAAEYTSKFNPNYYKQVILQSTKVLKNLNELDLNLVACRNLIVSSIKLKDQSVFDDSCKLIESIIEQDSMLTNFAGLHLLANSLVRGSIAFNSKRAETLARSLKARKPEDFIGKGIYAISDTKDEAEIMILSNDHNLGHIKSRLVRSLVITEEEHYFRHNTKIKLLADQLHLSVAI